MTCVTQNLVQNLMGLVIASKSNGKCFESSNSQITLEKRVYTHFATYGLD